MGLLRTNKLTTTRVLCKGLVYKEMTFLVSWLVPTIWLEKVVVAGTRSWRKNVVEPRKSESPGRPKGTRSIGRNGNVIELVEK